MSSEKIWQELIHTAVPKSAFFGRPIIHISKERFAVVERYFKSSFNILNSYQNYRSRSCFRHIHAIDKGDMVEVHIDLCNPDYSIVLNIPHFFIDVAPYFIAKWISRRGPSL